MPAAPSSNVFRAGDRRPTDWRTEAGATYTAHAANDVILANTGGAGGIPAPRADNMARGMIRLGYSEAAKPSTHNDDFKRYATSAYKDREPPCNPSAQSAGSPSRLTTRLVMPDGSVRDVTRVASGLDLGHDGDALLAETATRGADAGTAIATAALIANGGNPRPGEDGRQAAALAKEDHLWWQKDYKEVRSAKPSGERGDPWHVPRSAWALPNPNPPPPSFLRPTFQARKPSLK